MVIPISEDLVSICREIERQVSTRGAASLVWSDDEYQRETVVGGWSPEKSRFFFSFYTDDGKDFMFSLSIEEAISIAGGGRPNIIGEYWKESPLW